MKFKKYSMILFFILFMAIIYSLGIIKFNNWHNTMTKLHMEQIEDCKSRKEEYSKEEEREYCSKKLKHQEFVISYAETKKYYDDFIPFSSNFFIIFLIVLASCYYNSKYLKNNIISYDLARENYKKVKYKIFCSAWVSALVVPFFMVIKLIICFVLCFYQKGTTDILLWETTSTFNALYLFVDIIIALVDCLIITNICIVVMRKQHHFILSSILSYLCVIGIELFLEIVIDGLLINKIFGTDFGLVFNIITFGHFPDSYGIAPPLLVSLGIFIVTSLFVMRSYQDKEQLVIDCESNS